MIHLWHLFKKHYTNSQSHSRETNACGGCMFLAPPTHNNSEWRCRADTRTWVVWQAQLRARKLSETEKLNGRKVTLLRLFGNSSLTWSQMTNDRPALVVKCVDDHQPLPSSQQVLTQTELQQSCEHQPPASSQQTSPTAATCQTSLRQPTIAAAYSAPLTPHEKKPKWYKDVTSTFTHCTAKDKMPISTVLKTGLQEANDGHRV